MSLWSFLVATWQATPASVKAILTGLVGTLFGAWVASRASAKRRVIDELRALHSAYALCFTIANKALQIKRQHVRSMWERHAAAVEAWDAYAANPIGPFALDLDM